MAHKGWRNDSARHSLSARGVKTQPHKSARKHRMTIDEAEAADEAYKQLQRDLGDQDYIDAQYDLSDPDSAASINREAYMEGVEQAESEFFGEAVSELEKGSANFEKWLEDNCLPEYRDEVRGRAAEIVEEKRADEEQSPSKSITNDERSKAEVASFKKDKPKQYFAYYSFISNQVTTWTGDKLGDIVSKGEEWRSNMGDRRVQIRVKGINGVTYSGIAFLDAGDYTRLKVVKG